MVCYPLSTLAQAGIRDIPVVSKPWDTPRFETRELGESNEPMQEVVRRR